MLASLFDDNEAVPPEIQKRVVEYLLSTPKVLVLLVGSFFSGQIWVFVVCTYLKRTKKGNTYLDNVFGKTSLGILWFTPVILAVHWIKFQTWQFEAETLLAVVWPTLVFGMFAQLVLFGIITSACGERK